MNLLIPAVAVGITALLFSGKSKAKSKTSTYTPPSTWRPTIKVGSRGEVVAEWQNIIGVKADGIFGPITDAATRTYQANHGLVVDGIVGPKTWGAALGVK